MATTTALAVPAVPSRPGVMLPKLLLRHILLLMVLAGMESGLPLWPTKILIAAAANAIGAGHRTPKRCHCFTMRTDAA